MEAPGSLETVRQLAERDFLERRREGLEQIAPRVAGAKHESKKIMQRLDLREKNPKRPVA
jgi:hypothetical protein